MCSRGAARTVGVVLIDPHDAGALFALRAETRVLSPAELIAAHRYTLPTVREIAPVPHPDLAAEQ
jgi:hypothetical protein